MQVTCSCSNVFMSKQAPCPDGRENCLVCHYDENSFICPTCGHDCGPDIREALKDGHIVEEIGLYTANLAGIRKLELYR